jgi:REP element-mobilizing transposase RayT
MNKLSKRKRTRLKEYDYSKYGFYFVTICIKNRREFFSRVVNSNIVLTKYGLIVDQILKTLSDFYSVEIDYYVIMPDHLHLILILDNGLRGKNHSLSNIIGKFKSYCTKKIRENLTNPNEFEWQKSFFDRIIRNEKELFQIRKYIDENPLKWELEKVNPDNLMM